MPSCSCVPVIVIALFISVLHAAPAGAQPAVPSEQLDMIRAAAPDTEPAKPKKPRKLLVYTGCKGFVHSSIPTGAAAVALMGEKTGAYETTISDNPTVFAADKLKDFDAVCLVSTTGTLFDDEALRKSLMDFVHDGGGLAGIHAATDCFYDWEQFGELMGGYFDGHPWHENVTIKLEEPAHPVMAAFGGEPFEIVDEIYQFKDPYSRDRLHVLMGLDTSKTDMTKNGINRKDGDFAVSWVRNAGRGRVFYCSLGHREEIFWNPRVLRHYLAGIQFALGDLRASAVASNRIGKDGWIDTTGGADLTGWIAKPGSWSLVDSVLTLNGGDYIWTEQEYGDFVLDCEFKVDPGANSGIFFRTGNIDDCVQTGIEMQVYDAAGRETAGKNDVGAIYDFLAPSKLAAKPAGEWNHCVLTCKGPSVKVELNGEQIIDMDLDKWTEPGMNPDGSKNKFHTAGKDMPRVGRIGFQDHGSKVWYRHVRIKPLD